MPTPKPSDYFEIKIGDEDREIFMSYGLLNQMAALIGDPSQVVRISLDPDLRSEILRLALAKRKKSGKVLEEVEDVEDIDASYAEIEALLKWCMEHVLGFFVRLMSASRDVAADQKTAMADLVSSLDGSLISPSETE
jgi:hypothetical protein